MDIIIVIIVVVWVIFAEKKKKTRKVQKSTGTIMQQNTGKRNRQSVDRQSQPGQTGDTIQSAANAMQKSMTQTQRELKERLQKKYGNAAQAGRAVPQNHGQRTAPATQSDVQSTRVQQPARENTILSRAAANVQEEAVDELRFEQTENTAVESLGLATMENSPLMQQISDLMITGYTGELSFGRDFVAEGVEMLNRCEMMEF